MIPIIFGSLVKALSLEMRTDEIFLRDKNMPISTVWILNTLNNAMFKWFWTISSLGAPGSLMWSFGIRYSHASVITWELYMIVCGCKYDHVIALLTREIHSFGFPWSTSSGILNYLCPFHIHHLFQTYKTVRSSRSSTMNLLINDTQIKAKILSGDHAFSFCVPKLCNDSP